LLVILSICLLTPALTAQQGGFGLGVMLGEPTGISAKLWLGRTTALDGVVAWAFVNNLAISVHADYLFHFFDVFSVKEGTIPLYVGIGGMVSIGPEPDVGVGVRFYFPSKSRSNR
jgi:hypothetical protein